jgi:hypothetical protein
MPSGVGFSNVDISGLSNAGVGAGFGNMFTAYLENHALSALPKH